MRSEQDTKQLKEELVKLINFMGEHGSPDDRGERTLLSMTYALVALAWVLGEIPTAGFRRFIHLHLDDLGDLVKLIEKTTGQKLPNYE